MVRVRSSNLMGRAARQRIPFRRMAGLLAMLCLLVLPALAQTDTPAAPARGEAKIGITADLTAGTPDDLVTIRMVDCTDRDRLAAIARDLGARLHAEPTDLVFKAGDPRFVTDSGIGLDFRLPVVTRGESYLPIAPFIDAFAPYASRLRILYVIRGEFTYRGFQQYDRPDVSFTVDPPTILPPELHTPLAFYGMDVKIKNPALGQVALPNYPVQETPASPPAPSPAHRMVLIMLASLIGAAVGLLLVVLLWRWKEEDARMRLHQLTGEHK